MNVEFRDYRDRGDAVQIVNLRDQCAAVDDFDELSTSESFPTAEDIHEEREQVRFTLVEVLDVAVGYFSIRSWVEESGIRVYLHEGRVSPSARDRGVGTAIVVEGERRIRELAQDNEQVAFAANASSSEVAAGRLLDDNGYEVVFSLAEMELADLQSVAPARIEDERVALRAVTWSDLRALWNLNNIAYSGREFVRSATEEGFRRFINDAGDLSLWSVAWVDETPVAYVAGSLDGHRAEILEVCVHPDWRRKRLASWLLSLNLTELRNRGASGVRLHTNGENVSGAISLYRQFGFRTVKTYRRYRKPLS